MASYPSINDRDFDLIKKIAWNFRDIAIATGSSVTTEPRWNDTYFDLLKKITYYTAIIADAN